MPRQAVHMIVLDEVISRLRVSTNQAERRIGDLMYRNRQAAVLGCIGPDIFYWAPDFNMIGKLSNFYRNFNNIINLYNTIDLKIKEVFTLLGNPVENTVGTLLPSTVDMLKRIIEEIKRMVDLFSSMLNKELFSGVIDRFNLLDNLSSLPNLTHLLFDDFMPPMQLGFDERQWYWFDMLHCRETGTFARNLIRLAGNDETKLAYAYGYLTHIATDTVGHPFINQIVGGPYRMHPQRYTTCEIFVDSWVFFDRFGESINTGLFNQLNLPQTLPNGIADLLHRAFIETYQNKSHPLRINESQGGFLTIDNIRSTYDIFRFNTEVLGGITIKPPTEPFSGVLELLERALENFKGPPSPPEIGRLCSIEEFFSSTDCIEGFFESIAEWLEYFGELIIWTIETIFSLIDFVLTALLSLPIAVLMAILYGIQLVIYNLYRQARSVLMQAGLLCPEPDELQTSYGTSLVTPCYSRSSPFKGYPRVHSHLLHNILFPNTTVEEPGTLSAFYQRNQSSTPRKFIYEDSFSESNLIAYARATNPKETRDLQMKGRSIGNAISFSYWLIVNSLNSNLESVVYTNWNLFSDRGYGYKCWTTKQRLSHDRPVMVLDETYV
ncbi:MAG: zinc dependent phospholipase C family protein [Thermoproteota archaeon]